MRCVLVWLFSRAVLVIASYTSASSFIADAISRKLSWSGGAAVWPCVNTLMTGTTITALLGGTNPQGGTIVSQKNDDFSSARAKNPSSTIPIREAKQDRLLRR